MAYATKLGRNDALLTIHGRRLGISPPDVNGNCALLLDGLNVAGNSGINTQSGQGGITALAGGGQSLTAPYLSAEVNVISTVATTSDSLMLPSLAGAFPTSGESISVAAINTSSLAAAIFPSSGDQINALAANASLALASSGVTIFYALSSGHWYSK